ncbi:MAG: hypothetical protein HY699_00560 [Deltaproteobacteria bacterium]|nr:hypothetical protein [Deltaproteobacteria bacterium]
MRILFASPYRPFQLVGGADPLDPFTGQLSPTQGPFAMTMHSHYWAFYMIAENLNADSCVLEHPSMAEFEQELRKGYDYLGLQVNWNTLRKTAEMIERARALAPDTKIVIGGYAIAQIMDPLPPDEDIAAFIRTNTDYMCREEGVRFMRRLIGDQPLSRAITQYTMPRSGSYLNAIGPSLQAIGGRPILAALGCPAGCDFCNTSAFFKQRKLQVAEPDEAYSFMRHHLVADGTPRAQFELFDEDLYWDAQYSKSLGQRLCDDPVTRGRIGYFTFGTVRTLTRFDPEELLANGLGTVWIGVESTLDDVLKPSVHMGKRKGREVEALFRELHEVGIHTAGSIILGFDFHTPENVQSDVEAFLRLDPTISQVTPLVPCAGTKLYERMKQEQRLNPQFGWTTSGGFQAYPPVAPRHFTWAELQAVIEHANRRLYNETGPSALKGTDTTLRGYLRLRHHRDPVLRARAQTMGETVKGHYPMIQACVANAPSKVVQEKALATRARWLEAFGEPDEQMVALGGLLADQIRRYADNPPPPPECVDPPTRWTYYRPGTSPEVIKQAAA